MKSDRATIKRRVEEVLQLRLLGAELLDIRQHAAAADPPWNKSDRTLFRYIRAADERLAKMLDSNRERLFARHIGQRRALFARCMAVSDYKTAAGILRDEGLLLRLYDAPPAPKPTGELPTKTGDVVKLLAARLAGIDQAELPADEQARLAATLADTITRAIQADNLVARVEVLEMVLKQRDKGSS